jgi:exodeoxyribonuclease-1
LNNNFYWHDYETWGADPSTDRPAQFAGQRTDWNLNPIGEPLVVYAKPANDMLPQPEACILTGLTPQFATQHGLPEAIFMARIHKELSQPNTCGAGYNNLRFDDEITRYALFRNFFDPYGREWRNGNSRWDLIDVMRLAHALRPDGINWPQQDGVTSFKLTSLTAANNLTHEAAHEALSDVLATIELARLLRTQQPRLFEFSLSLRDKRKVNNLLGLFPNSQPLLHVSSKYPAELGCIAPVLTLGLHPVDKNGVIVVDLRIDPALLLDLDVDTIKQRVFTKREDLPENVSRIPLKVVHINRVPMLAPMATLTSKLAEKWNIDLPQVQVNAARFKATPELHAKLQQVFLPPEFPPREPEHNLYGGLLSNADLAKCEMVRLTTPQKLQSLNVNFHDQRLTAMLFRYRARNWPETLTIDELKQWSEYCHWRLTEVNSGSSITVSDYKQQLQNLQQQYVNDDAKLKVIQELNAWAKQIVP